jgi:hypothetical protein
VKNFITNIISTINSLALNGTISVVNRIDYRRTIPRHLIREEVILNDYYAMETMLLPKCARIESPFIVANL